MCSRELVAFAAVGAEPLDGFALSPEWQACGLQDSALHGHATPSQHSSASHLPMSTWVSKSLSPSLFLLGQITQAEVYAQSPRYYIILYKLFLVCDSTFPCKLSMGTLHACVSTSQSSLSKRFSKEILILLASMRLL